MAIAAFTIAIVALLFAFISLVSSGAAHTKLNEKK